MLHNKLFCWFLEDRVYLFEKVKISLLSKKKNWAWCVNIIAQGICLTSDTWHLSFTSVKVSQGRLFIYYSVEDG